MQTKPTLSNSKIIFLVAFICCAIMSSLFLFHLRHKQTLTTLADGSVLIFPVARDIKPFNLVSTENQKFSQANFLNHWTIVFFGFTHCTTICPATMNLLGHTYDKLHKAHPNLQVVLISLDPARDNLSALTKFTHSFNPAFIGASGKIQEVRKLQSQLGIFSQQDKNTAGNNYQIQHSSSILLINPQGKWAAVFKYGMKPEEFMAAFAESMKSHA